MPLASGTLLNNRYRIVSILGQGGMGAVYRASDEHLHIPVAVKENLFLTEEYGRQFQREATILAGLRHSNLPHVTDYFSQENHIQYLVMDFIEGEDLRQRMERLGSLPEREAMLIGISISEALAYLHSRRPPIVHRDIKPGNIKVTPDGQAVLVDFGLAKIMQGSQATSTGARAMTPGYSPPEQYGTARTDPRSDIYSLGATLYATLTGVIPEDGLARMTGRADLTPIRDLVPKVSRKLADTIERALEVDPDDRFQNAEEFKRALIESGELAPFYQEPPSIPPPPSSAEAGAYNGILREDEESESFRLPAWERSSRRRRRKSLSKYALWLAAFGAILWFGFFIFNNLFGGYGDGSAFLPAASARPTQSTEVLSMHADPPTEEPAPPTETAPVVVVPEDTPTLAPTFSPEPDPTITPTITATPTGGSHQIAFASDLYGQFQILILDTSKRNIAPRQITNMDGGACQPTWSPDGLRIAFTSPCPGKQETYPGSRIYMVNADGTGEVVQLTNSMQGDFDPAWSPRGDKIAFTSLRPGRPAIYLLNMNDLSAPAEEVSRLKYSERQPSWAPSGLQITFTRFVGTWQIWTMGDNGSSQVQYSRSGANNWWPVWSHDGQGIFFSQTRLDSSIPSLKYLLHENRGTGNETVIPSSTSANVGPINKVSPSPDGNWLAFEGWPDGTNHDIYIMQINGSELQRLTTDIAYDFGAAWRPIPNNFTE
jgi:eukaryotic-like serine/threonine-protein kinase